MRIKTFHIFDPWKGRVVTVRNLMIGRIGIRIDCLGRYPWWSLDRWFHVHSSEKQFFVRISWLYVGWQKEKGL